MEMEVNHAEAKGTSPLPPSPEASTPRTSFWGIMDSLSLAACK